MASVDILAAISKGGQDRIGLEVFAQRGSFIVHRVSFRAIH
jgi:hypothetical protein